VNIAHILAVLFALVGIVPAITLASPIRVAHRAIPTIMLIASLALWFMPTGIDIALALGPVAAWISARLGIEHAGHEPADYSAATQKVRSATQAACNRIRKPEPVEIQRFVTQAYPSPEDAAELAQTDPADIEDDPGDSTAATASTEREVSPDDAMREKLASLTQDPRMPHEAATRLAGQRSGRDTSVGLRGSATRAPVPSYVPAL
jgi:hypothetical protein